MSNQAEQLQNDLRLIQEVERHLNLYDPRCKDKDSKSREQTWGIIGSKLNTPPDVCKNRWKNLRDKYTREKKLMMTEGEESYRNHPWPLLDEMSFLWNFVSHRNSRPQQLRIKKSLESDLINGKYTRADWRALTAGYSDVDETVSIEPNFLDPACVLVEEDEPLEPNDEDEDTAPRSKLRRLLENKEEENSDSQNENLTDSNYHSDSVISVKVPQPPRLMDEEEYFCMSLAGSLKRLPKQKSSLLKIKIMQIIHEAEFGQNEVKNENNNENAEKDLN